MKNHIIRTLLNGMSEWLKDDTMMRNGCLTLCQFSIPYDVVSEFNSCPETITDSNHFFSLAVIRIRKTRSYPVTWRFRYRTRRVCSANRDLFNKFIGLSGGWQSKIIFRTIRSNQGMSKGGQRTFDVYLKCDFFFADNVKFDRRPIKQKRF